MRKAWVLFLVLGLILVGCGQKAEQPAAKQAVQKIDEKEIIRKAADRYLTTAPDNWRIVKPEWLKEKIDSGQTADIFILDVRPDFMYAEGHIKGAVNIPLKTLCKKENLQKLPEGKQIVLICVSGHTASMANAILNMLGYNAVTMKGGMNAWKAAGYPVEK